MRSVKFLIVVAALLALPSYARPDGPCPGIENTLAGIRPMGYEKITVSTSPVSLTVPVTPTVRFAVVAVLTNSVNSLDTGSNPTASDGMTWNAGEKFVVCQSSLAAWRAIRVTADAELRVLYYGN